ncbi:DnaJ domain-containing protein [uncultured Thiodictyon sp.]|uniref:DnaJ domain-containing protein n=1 Tax=uncultured Thiodictyon sp. TaxID=1846217 RepID=UPI0025D0A52E|nr:DnaJ domain-containing protein [uncultured Thiodictyon sp.]
MKTLYDILEVSALASKEAIDASYQRLRAGWQPQADQAAGNQTEHLRRDAIARAYAVLSDPDERTAYDERIRNDEARRDRRRTQDSGGLFSESFSFAKKPLLFLLAALAPVFAIGYLLAAHKSPSSATTASETSHRDHQSAVPESDEDLESKGPETRGKGRDSADEIAALQLEAQRLEVENRRLQNEALKSEQERRDKQTAAEVTETDRGMTIQEKDQAIRASEIAAERKHTDELDQAEATQRRVDEIYRTIEVVKDKQAAEMNMTRRQYDKYQEDTSSY